MALWLWVLCGITFGMVVLGGLTRLTQSGLSMTHWSLVGGLPPLTEAGWQAEFARYQQFPEYQQINQGMSLGAFQRIYWFEYSHRMLGRLIGLAFLVPFGAFVALRAVPLGLLVRLLGLLGLLVGQGLIGWWMVRSGLVDRPDVSHYRLTIHLGAAFLFYGAMFWTALSLWRGAAASKAEVSGGLRRWVEGIVGMVYGTVLLGGLVAGSNAGFTFNTFPLMGGRLIPSGYLALSPWWRNAVENIVAMQFHHRWVAILTLVLIGGAWGRGRRLGLGGESRRAMDVLLGAGLLQVVLGITTLLTVVWLPVASAHQAGALVLLSAALWAAHVLRYPASAARTGTSIVATVGTSGARVVTMPPSV